LAAFNDHATQIADLIKVIDIDDNVKKVKDSPKLLLKYMVISCNQPYYVVNSSLNQKSNKLIEPYIAIKMKNVKNTKQNPMLLR